MKFLCNYVALSIPIKYESFLNRSLVKRPYQVLSLRVMESDGYGNEGLLHAP